MTRSLKGPASNAREVVHSAKGKSETILKFTWYKCNLRLSVSKLHLYIYMFQIALYAIHHKYTVQVYIQKSTEAKLCLNHQTLQFYNAKLNDHFFFCGASCMWNLSQHVLQAHTKVILTYSLTPWSRVLPEKLTGSHLVKKFPALYGTRRLTTTFTSDYHLPIS